MTEYFTKLRTISDGLVLAGSPLSNTDLITYLISGLDHSYYPVVVYIEVNMLTMDLSEAYAMLLKHEARLENNKIVDSKEAKSNYMANVAQTRNFQMKGNGNNQNNWNKNEGGNWNQNFAVEVEDIKVKEEVTRMEILMLVEALLVVLTMVDILTVEVLLVEILTVEVLLVTLTVEMLMLVALAKVVLGVIERTLLREELCVRFSLDMTILLLIVETGLAETLLQAFRFKATIQIKDQSQLIWLHLRKLLIKVGILTAGLLTILPTQCRT